jgi:glycosyltransferase involved in cell wall biosynthesis
MRFRRLAINAKFLTASAEPTGVHRVAEQLILQLAECRHEFSDLFQEPPVLLAPANLEKHALDVFELKRGGFFRGQLWEQIDLPRLTRSDLLLNLCNLGPIASRSAITMIHDAQVFISPESYEWGFRNWYRGVLPIVGRRHSRILAISNFTADQLVHYGVTSRNKISIVPNGVGHLLKLQPEPAIIERLGLTRRGFVIGLANAQAHKNVALLIRAFSDPALADLKLVLVGSAQREDFEHDCRVPQNVRFTGWVSDQELRALLEAALCFGFPSTTEGFGLPPLEGMTFGCPAVVAPCGALPEVCSDAAMYAAPNAPAEWVSAIRRLKEDPDCWGQYSSAGLKRVDLYTWKRAGNALIEVIRQVAAKRAASSTT